MKGSRVLGLVLGLVVVAACSTEEQAPPNTPNTPPAAGQCAKAGGSCVDDSDCCDGHCLYREYCEG